jgi:predicted nucleic acid-binding protein
MIISNTTPISNLLHADNISLLAKLFGTVYIPDAVANEVNVVFSSCAEWQKCVEREQIII